MKDETIFNFKRFYPSLMSTDEDIIKANKRRAIIDINIALNSEDWKTYSEYYLTGYSIGRKTGIDCYEQSLTLRMKSKGYTDVQIKDLLGIKMTYIDETGGSNE